MTRKITMDLWNRGLRFEVPETGLLHGVIRWPDGHLRPMFGCRRCGIDNKYHPSFYVPYWGYHEWERPTNTQIMLRMRARRTIMANVRKAHQDDVEKLRQRYTRWSTVSHPTGPDDVES